MLTNMEAIYLCLWVEIEHGIWEIQESNFMGTEFSMDLPFIKAEFTGLHNRYLTAALNQRGRCHKKLMKVGYHNFKKDSFCARCVLDPAKDGPGEDSGWIVSWVHN